MKSCKALTFAQLYSGIFSKCVFSDFAQCFKRSIRAGLFPSLCPRFRLFDKKAFDFSEVEGNDTGQHSDFQ